MGATDRTAPDSAPVRRLWQKRTSTRRQSPMSPSKMDPGRTMPTAQFTSMAQIAPSDDDTAHRDDGAKDR